MSKSDYARTLDNAYALSIDEVLAALNSGYSGLSAQQAAERLVQVGANSLPHAGRVRIGRIFLRQFLDPFIYILLLAALFALLLAAFSDAAFICAILLINAIIGTIQEFNAQRSAVSLQSFVSEFADVVRDGDTLEIDIEQLVPGDVVVLQSGDKVPADIRLLQTHQLRVDQSLLTGESIAVSKDNTHSMSADTPHADQQNSLFKGTLITSGRALGVVTATGMQTYLGAIAGSVILDTKAKPPLLLRMEQFTRSVAVTICVAAAVMAVMLAMQEVSLHEIFFLAVALIVAAIPEGLPVALTVALAIGVRRMARRQVIARRLVTVEALGSCTMIASDKTGTLTVNEITARKIILPNRSPLQVEGEGVDPQGEVQHEDASPCNMQQDHQLRSLALSIALANESFWGKRDGEWAHHGDAVDVAMLVLAYKLGVKRPVLLEKYPEQAVIPYESELGYSAALHRVEQQATIFVKGAFEKIMPMCNRMLGPDGVIDMDTAWCEQQSLQLASNGYRVLAVAYGVSGHEETKSLEANDLQGLIFVGLIGLIDPLRSETKEAVAACRSAGIDVAMITGDHPQTALAIARELGLASDDDQVVTGMQLQQVQQQSEQNFDQLVASSRVFARVEPQQKLHIVQAMQRNGHFVAVTGDGANDAPALRVAQVGVAMGAQGTDLARETADMIIADDNFASIVAGVEEGRIAYANVRKVIHLLISAGAAEIVLFALALATGYPVPLFAVQLLWLNLVTNGIQDMALAFEPGEGDELQKPPRAPQEGIFNRIMIERVLLGALLVGVISFLVFRYLLEHGFSVEQARNMTLLLMVLFENIQAFNSRSETRSVFRHNLLDNPLLLFGTLIAQLIHIGAMYTRVISDILHLQPVSLQQWVVLLALSLSVLAGMEVYKFMFRRSHPLQGVASR